MAKKRVRKATLDTKITVRLDPDQLKKLEQYADQEGTTVSFMVRHLVKRFIEERDRSSRYAPTESIFPSLGGW